MATLKNTSIQDTGNLTLPAGSTEQRPTTATGQMRFNTSTGKVELYNSNAWVPLMTQGIQASGGDSVYDIDSDGTTYRVHVFTSANSTFTVTKGGNIDYLIVGGGGAGGFGDRVGGGGAGGFITGSTTVTTQNYAISIGAGGVGPDGDGRGTNGSNTTAFGLTALGGGGGGNSSNTSTTGPAGKDGASGGGAGNGSAYSSGVSTTMAAGNGTSGQGNAGGTSVYTPDYGGGGGGGAGEIGGSFPGGSGVLSGKGGDGILTNITGFPTYYAGGAAGRYYNQTPLGNYGGFGGGGISFSGTSPGIPNTGGGGSGNEDGGSGIVIVRYPLSRESLSENNIPKIVTNGLMLEYDFSNPYVYSGAGSTTLNDSRLGPYASSISGTDTPIPYGLNSHGGYLDLNNQQLNTNLLSSEIAGSNYYNPFAFEIWVKITAYPQPLATANQYGNTRRAGMLFGAASYAGIGLAWEGNDNGDYCGVRAYTRNSSSTQTDAYSLPLNTWTHLMQVNNGSGTMTLYANGAFVADATIATGATTRDASAGNIAVAKVGVTGGGVLSYIRLPCQVGLARIYNGLFSADDVDNNYNATRWRFGV